MVWRLSGTRSLAEPMLTGYQWTHMNKIQWNFNWKSNHFHSRKLSLIWKYRFQNICQVILALICVRWDYFRTRGYVTAIERNLPTVAHVSTPPCRWWPPTRRWWLWELSIRGGVKSRREHVIRGGLAADKAMQVPLNGSKPFFCIYIDLAADNIRNTYLGLCWYFLWWTACF